jgi:anthranilate/para-aminobenzoate synthase component II
MLHNLIIKDDAKLHESFQVYARKDGIGSIQAIKHKHFKHYGLLFHPEVRNKDLILNFLEA